jgi:hypothetical protein
MRTILQPNRPSSDRQVSARDVRVAIVGAGPHALTVAAHLVQLDPGLLDDELAIIDPSGEWLQQWRRRMRAFGIAHLRSPVVHHPAPEPYALQDFARGARRSRDLHGRYQLPGTALFDDFCDDLIERCGLVGRVEPATAEAITADGCIQLADGRIIRAQHVIVTHGARQPCTPQWASGSDAVHAEQVDLSTVEAGMRVTVVGGGITAAHLAVGARARGAMVRLISRRDIVEREFDSDPGWLGPKYLQGFLATTDLADRAAAVRAARGGGSVPAWLLAELRAASGAAVGRPALSPSCGGRLAAAVNEVSEASGTQVRLASGEVVDADALWCATGWRSDVASDRLLGPLLRSVDQQDVDGFVVLDHRLRMRSTVVHVTGPPAALALGPAAGNLSGARRSARAVASTVFGVERADQLGET